MISPCSKDNSKLLPPSSYMSQLPAELQVNYGERVRVGRSNADRECYDAEVVSRVSVLSYKIHTRRSGKLTITVPFLDACNFWTLTFIVVNKVHSIRLRNA
jgi:hypothetical protein